MEWYYFLCVYVVLIVISRLLKTKNRYLPERILTVNDDFLVIEDYPKTWFSKALTRKITKSTIYKIQIAHNIVTFFNASDNAVDIHLPKKSLAQPIFKRAITLFPNAQSIEIEN